MNLPNPLAFNVQGIETRPHDDHRRTGYLLRVKSMNVWMDVEDAIRNGVVPMPTRLPSNNPTPPTDWAEVQARLTHLQQNRNQP